ncbi:MAG: hypothetical protein PHH40_02745 [Candidatus Moranbacteria bacterium]|nr:hypothetical protein [Candidatus Moranbacteria bacterium]MDD3965189.1 hypothetical protein [Candidatus Moranbacteria bacterium]
MFRENPKTGVLEESDALGLFYSPVTNESGRMSRRNPDTGIKEQSDLLGLSWSPVINDAGKMTRTDPETNELQQSGLLNLWWDPVSRESAIGNDSNAHSSDLSSGSSLNTPLGSGGSYGYSSGGTSSDPVCKRSGTAVSVRESRSGKSTGVSTNSNAGSASSMSLGDIACVTAGAVAVVVVGGFIASLFEDKNVIKRLPDVTPPPSRAHVYVFLLFLSFVAASFLLSGLTDDFHRFDLTKVFMGGICSVLCLLGWIFVIDDERNEEKEYQIAVKKREAENREIDRRNKAYLEEKAASKKRAKNEII